MRRYCLRKDSKSSTGGVIQEGCETSTHHGIPLTYLGAKVFCPACKSMGVIVPKGPRRIDTFPDGRQQALDGDLCLCKCPTPPVMIASQDTAYHSFDEQGEQSSGLDDGSMVPKYDQWTMTHDEQFMFQDKTTGKPLAYMPYTAFLHDGEIVQGITDEGGRTNRFLANGPHPVRIQFGHARGKSNG